MLIFVHEKTSAPPPGDLTPLPCLLTCWNWLLHPRLILSNANHAYTPASPSRSALTPLTPPRTRLILSGAYHPYTRGVPSRHASDAAYHP
ncbi:hypothetical protein O181_123316 [Austropuccinia psidii MF-1]|uniref:Uncharacterized protein n=1 Tax=Austropuccinia psidii MF-1 TaxID=1389203 RepID=A0A9Q3KP03_9BASI|nr:hypothetical protein [Austropuccinia psidii MF-1]